MKHPSIVCFFLFSLTTVSIGEQIPVVLPRVALVAREGITGAGHPAQAGHRLLALYPNHPDDFGGSGGSGASVSEDGGATWRALDDDWPLGKTVDGWADRLRNGTLVAFAIHWVPDPKRRGELTAMDVPEDAYQIAFSADQGLTWRTEKCVLECPAEYGVIARPLPHLFEDESGALHMPAYAWSKTGTRALLLRSTDGGRRWTVLSCIASAAAITKAGAPVTTPWLETTVSPTKGGHWLAIVRTGSGAQASLVAARSSDRGKTWSEPERLAAAGKLPTLQLLPNGALALLTAHSKNHCRLYLSPDGEGNGWGAGHIITSQSGGNAGMTVTGKDTLLAVSPANGRIDAWRVTLRPPLQNRSDLAAPSDISFQKGLLRWASASVAHEVTPVLIEKAAGYEEAEILPYAPIRVEATQLDLGRQLLIGATYRFEVRAVDAAGRASAPCLSANFVNR